MENLGGKKIFSMEMNYQENLDWKILTNFPWKINGLEKVNKFSMENKFSYPTKKIFSLKIRKIWPKVENIEKIFHGKSKVPIKQKMENR